MYVSWVQNIRKLSTLSVTRESLSLISRLYNVVRGKKKGKVRPSTCHEGPEGEQKYSSTLSLSSALDGSG